jgi:hypothetical protein
VAVVIEEPLFVISDLPVGSKLFQARRSHETIALVRQLLEKLLGLLSADHPDPVDNSLASLPLLAGGEPSSSTGLKDIDEPFECVFTGELRRGGLDASLFR